MLYEMVTGHKAFEGKSQASLISAIMSSGPPPVTALRPIAPPALDHVVRKCLAKDRDERWQNAGDLAAELKWISEAGSQAGLPAAVVTRRARSQVARWLLAGLPLVAVIAALAVGLVRFREAPAQQRSVRFSIPAPEGVTLRTFDSPVVSPDGQRIVFSGQLASERSLLFVRPLNSLATRTLPGTEGAYFPFWSPDSRSVAFFTPGKLNRIDLADGSIQPVCDVPRLGIGGTWNRDGIIVFGGFNEPLYEVRATGGRAVPLTSLDRFLQETAHVTPCFLPDQRHFLYLAQSSKPENNAICVGSLRSKQTKRVLAANSSPTYAPPGYLLFVRGQSLMAQRFEASQQRLTGEAFLLLEQILVEQVRQPGFTPAIGSFSASENQILGYRPGTILTQLVWFDRTGKRLGTAAEPAVYTNPALSPDEKRLAVSRTDPQTNMRDVWVLDLARGASSRLTFDPADDLNPLWSPDGRWIAFASDRKGPRDLYVKLASGLGSEEVLLESSSNKALEDWSRDGRFIFFAGRGLWALPVSPGRPSAAQKPVPVLQGPGGHDQSQLSPDGRWLAYRSSESGRGEIYVQPFPPTGGKWQISPAGGSEPRWRGDGKELFYVSGARLMAVEVKASPSSFEAGVPRPLFEAPLDPVPRRNRYVVTADGQRFLLVAREETGTAMINVVLNWPAGLKR